MPRWSGDTLDLIVDFTTYVFVPAYAIAASGMLPEALAIAAGVVVVHHRRALFRRPQHEDRRQLFPRLSGGVESGGLLSLSCWSRRNGSPPRLIVALAALELCADQVPASAARQAFARAQHRLLVAWAVLALVAVIEIFSPGPYVTWPLALIALYFFVAGLLPRPRLHRSSLCHDPFF